MDATLIAATSSTKNQKKERAPEMHPTRKGKQWYFGMKAPSGADRDSKLVHTLVVTSATLASVTTTVCTSLLSRSAPMCALIPKYH